MIPFAIMLPVDKTHVSSLTYTHFQSNAVKFYSSQTSNCNCRKLTAVVPHVMQCASLTLRACRNNVALRRLLCTSCSTQTSAAVELGKSAGGGSGEFTQRRSHGWRFCGSSAASRIVTVVDRTNPSTLYSGVEEMSSEEAVGILTYANSCPGFRGILKQRFSDFIVNEVDLCGNVTHLTKTEADDEEKDEIVKVPEETIADVKVEKEIPKSDEYAADVLAFKEIAGETNAKVLEDLLIQIAGCKGEAVPPVTLSPDDDKNHRGTIHSFFKTRLTFIVTDTVDGPTSKEKCVRLRHQIGGGGGVKRFQKRGRDSSGRGRDNKRQKPTDGDCDQPYDDRGSDGWPADRPKFLQFYLYKENKDTQDALTVISRMLHVQPKSFGFAGTKDKRAITTQRVTVFKQTAAKMAALNKRLFGLRVGNYSYVEKGLVLGQLSGNRFTVTLRGVVAESDDVIKNAFEGLGRSGFINYFGLQRFGSGSIATHSVGAALLRGEWKAAVNLILDPREGDQPEVKEAREYYKKTGNADGALHRFPRYLTGERALLMSLKRDANNCLQAINTIPRTLRLMYVHSYQSYLWNHAASHRTKVHGVEKVVEGDLVYNVEGDCDFPVEAAMVKPEEIESTFPNQEVGNTEVVLDDIVDVDVASEGPSKVKCVTAEDVATGRYQIWDVVLPLPGGSTLYPKNDTADVYHKLAGKDSVDLHTCTHNVKEYSVNHLPGGYRRLLQKPMDLEWKILKYTDATKSLAETDLERLKNAGRKHGSSEFGVQSGAQSGHHANLNSASILVPKSEEVETILEAADVHLEEAAGENSAVAQTAAQLSFTLPASCYATMAIRELLKISTSVAFHKSLNDEPAK